MSPFVTKDRFIWLGILGLCLAWGLGCNCDDPAVGQQPRLVVKPTAVVFPVIAVGGNLSRDIEISNQGTAPLELKGIQLDPKGDPAFSYTPPEKLAKLPVMLAPQEQVKLQIEFRPTAAGQPQSALWIDSNDPSNGHFIVPIRTVGNAPQIQVKPQSIQFGFAELNQKVTREVEVSNIGSADLQVQKASITSVSKDFSVDASELPKTLAAGAKMILKVSYQPSDTGSDLGELWIESDDPVNPKVRVLLEGRRSEPDIAVRPTLLDFGGVAPNQSRSLPLIIANQGGAALNITHIEPLTGTSSEFSVIHPPLPIRIEPGRSISVATFYAPKDIGTDQGVLEIKSDDPDSPSVKVQMVGQSPPAGLEVRPLLLDFGNIPANATKTLSLQISNTGAIPIQLKALPIQSATNTFQLATNPTLPQTLQPNTSVSVQVTFAPTGGTSHKGTLTVQSDDPASPDIPVTLLGNVVAAPPCFLKANPSIVNFGPVDVGKSLEKTIEITNVGTGTCFLFQVGLGPNTDFDFLLTAGAIQLPVTLGPNGKYNARVAYTPQQAGTAQGTLQVVPGDALFNPNARLQVPLTAIGAGPRLCIAPVTVDFGAVTIGANKNEKFQIHSCGTQPLVLSKIALDATTSKEYSIVQPPTLPQTLAVGQTLQVTAQFAPTDTGFELGKVELHSNAAGTPINYAYLWGYGIEKGQTCGALSGQICAPDGTTWLADATVSIQLSNGQTVQAKTDLDGRFYLPCVPPGAHKVQVKKGSYSTEFTALVSANATNALPNPQCVDPARTKIAVLWGEYDSIQHILDRLKLTYTLYDEKGFPTPSALLHDLTEMKKYNIIFFNCGMDESFVDSQVIDNMRKFVQGGGSIYASDFSYDFIEVAWPSAVTWLGNDSSRNDAQQGVSGKVDATVHSPLLIHRLGGRSKLIIDYTICPCTIAEKAETGTNALLTGDRSKSGNPNQPLALQFQPYPNGGNVIYTTFHNNEQSSATIDIILKFMIFEL